MPPAIFAAVTTYVSATVIGGTIAAAALKLAVIAFVAAGASYLIAKAQARSAFQDQAQGRLLSRREPIAPHRIVYGKLRVGGPIVFLETTSTSNEFLHIVIVLASHEINAVTAVYFDDYELQLDGSGNETGDFDGFARVKWKLGTANQTAFEDLVTESDGLWTVDHRLRGRAALYVRLKYSTDKFPNGIPNITAIIEGKKVYDPRSLTTAYSTNPALIIADFLKDTAYGLGVPSNEIDQTALIAAANICDEDIPLDAGGTENRYEAHGSFDSVETPEAILNKLVTSMAGKLLLTNGYWVILAGAYRTPTITLDEDDLRAGIRIQTLQSKNQQFNSIRGVFAAPENLYQPTDFPAIKSATYIAEDSGVETWKDITLPFTTSVTMAQRLAKIDLLRSRQQISLIYPAKLSAFNVQVGDVVYINNTRLGWSSKPFEVVSNTIVLNDEDGALLIGFDLDLRETATNVYDWDASEEQPFDPAPNTNLPDPFTVASVTGLTATPVSAVMNDGSTQPQFLITWDALSDFFVNGYEVQWLRGAYGSIPAETIYNSVVVNENKFTIPSVIPTASYTIRVRAINTLGVRSAFETISGQINNGDEGAPDVVTALTAAGAFGQITLSWVNPTNKDFAYVEIYSNSINDSGTATLIATINASSFIDSGLGNAVTKYYWLKSVDFTGNKSAFSSAASAATTYIDDADFENGIYTLFKDQGLYAIRDVTSLPTSGSFVGEKIFNRTDGKLYQWTGSAWELVIAEPDTFIASDKIIANTITGGLLATSGIITNSAQINSAVITSAKIQDLAVDRIKINNAAVTQYYLLSSSGQAIDNTTGEVNILTQSVPITVVSSISEQVYLQAECYVLTYADTLDVSDTWQTRIQILRNSVPMSGDYYDILYRSSLSQSRSRYLIRWASRQYTATATDNIILRVGCVRRNSSGTSIAFTGQIDFAYLKIAVIFR